MKVGDKVSFRNRLERTRVDSKKYWKSIDCVGIGIWIGYRLLSDGKRHYEDDCGYVYMPDRFFRAELIVFNERRNAIFVLPENVKPK